MMLVMLVMLTGWQCCLVVVMLMMLALKMSLQGFPGDALRLVGGLIRCKPDSISERRARAETCMFKLFVRQEEEAQEEEE